jgi:hypothetical protein
VGPIFTTTMWSTAPNIRSIEQVNIWLIPPITRHLGVNSSEELISNLTLVFILSDLSIKCPGFSALRVGRSIFTNSHSSGQIEVTGHRATLVILRA